jgi:hypothetical protein
MNLVPVHHYQLKDRWEWVKAGLQRAISKAGYQATPEDVYALLKAQKAWLYEIHHAERIGFFVLQQEVDTDGLCLFVFCLWLERGAGKVFRESLVAELRKLRDAMGAKRIRCHGREGWQRVPGFKVVSYVYEVE